MLRGLALFALLLISGPVLATSLRIAVASNFLIPLEAIAEAYHQKTGIELRISAGSTGQHYAQIVNGAPFDVFLAADQLRPQRLVKQGFALSDSKITYAQGSLVLWAAPEALLPQDGVHGLTDAKPRRLAIANPRLAPYGQAAKQALIATGQWEALDGVVVEGKNVAQALQFLATGNASHALIAASFVNSDNRPAGRWRRVDPALHDPIRQDAVILQSASDPVAARAFLKFLQGPESRAILEQFFYLPAGDG